MTIDIFFAKTDLLIALDKIKVNKSLVNILFYENQKENTIDLLSSIEKYLYDLEENRCYTFLEIIPPFGTEGKFWYLWYRKILILTFLAQFTNNDKDHTDSTTTFEGNLEVSQTIIIAGDLVVKGNIKILDDGNLIVLGNITCNKIEQYTYAGIYIICGRNLVAQSVKVFSAYVGVGGGVETKVFVADYNDTTIQICGDLNTKIWFDEDISSDSFVAGGVKADCIFSDSIAKLYGLPHSNKINLLNLVLQENFLNKYQSFFTSNHGSNGELLFPKENLVTNAEETKLLDILSDAASQPNQAIR
jgi:hypothetical protein